MSDETRGLFIAFEGGEGTGKSTQTLKLADALRARGKVVEVTREPGGTPGAEAIRQLLLHPPGDGWGAQAEALLFAAARSDHVAQHIKPSLEKGVWVVTDRFVDSSRAYQGGAGGLGDEAITALHAFGSDGLRPDLTILLEVDEDRLTQRLAERDGGTSDAIGGRSADYHRAVAARFRKLAEADPNGFRIVDGTGTPDEVHNRVLDALADLLGQDGK
ncbi:thymidylate kinase [Erythrobacter sp. NAP1]|uniref:dTMP kinase n=1 Tax=Erythrobacter sp. NAP1 TaxID=237727 RepID=UPI00006869CA|nr:dTMP kinase [Erythrobacter sp. NAP1]EAQ30203.1 thymidylate kinase [Erythrobacter sp. NAP1]